MLAALSALALAATGGPQTLTALGFEPSEHKLFLLSQRFDEGGDLPQLLYYRLDLPPPEQRSDQPVQVTSYYQSLGDQPFNEFEQRIERLKRTLQPLTPAPLRGIEVTLSFGDRKVCDPMPEAPPCEQVVVTVRWAGQQATTALTTWGDFEIAGAFTVPSTDARLVILRHIGNTTESGYTTEVPLLLSAQ